MNKFILLVVCLFVASAHAFTLTAYDALPPKKWTAPVEEEKPDEIKETARALFRVFQLGDKASENSYPTLTRPMGWSGEIGDGPKTAYDCLPPRKYKPVSP